MCGTQKNCGNRAQSVGSGKGIRKHHVATQSAVLPCKPNACPKESSSKPAIKQRKASGHARKWRDAQEKENMCGTQKSCGNRAQSVGSAKEYESTTRQPNQQVYHASQRHAPKNTAGEEEGGETTSGYGAGAHSRSVKGELGWARYISVVNVSMYHQNWPLQHGKDEQRKASGQDWGS